MLVDGASAGEACAGDDAGGAAAGVSAAADGGSVECSLSFVSYFCVWGRCGGVGMGMGVGARVGV